MQLCNLLIRIIFITIILITNLSSSSTLSFILYCYNMWWLSYQHHAFIATEHRFLFFRSKQCSDCGRTTISPPSSVVRLQSCTCSHLKQKISTISSPNSKSRLLWFVLSIWKVCLALEKWTIICGFLTSIWVIIQFCYITRERCKCSVQKYPIWVPITINSILPFSFYLESTFLYDWPSPPTFPQLSIYSFF